MDKFQGMSAADVRASFEQGEWEVWKAEHMDVRRPAEPAGNRLDPLEKSCNSETGFDDYEIRPCRCKCWYCPECAKWMGYALRRRLIERIKGWESVVMVTLTVDRKLFRGAQEAYEWVREHRGIGLLCQGLRRAGYVQGKGWICFLEFQEGGWPHWHMLVQAKYIPKELVSELWGRRRPPGFSLEKTEGRKGLGFVDVRRFNDVEHGVNYGTKYLIKEPKNGWPDWVMAFEGRVGRYSVSRGFWGVRKKRSAAVGDGPACLGHPAECFCCDCAGPGSGEAEPRRAVRTIEERLARCGRGSLLVRRRRVFDREGNELRRERECIGVSRASVADIRAAIGGRGESRGDGGFVVGKHWLGGIRDYFWGVAGVGCERFNRDLGACVPF